MWLLLRTATTYGYYRDVDEDFEQLPLRQSDELNSDSRRLGRAARPAAQSRARAESRPGADFDPELVEQYLAYLSEARALKLEIAADYLVMAAWLAYLKSCLLLPKDPEQDPSPEEIALRLQLRLQRLDAMREAGARLLGRDRIGRDVFLRGAPEGLRLVRKAPGRSAISTCSPLTARSGLGPSRRCTSFTRDR